jgi:hypothetical protein
MNAIKRLLPGLMTLLAILLVLPGCTNNREQSLDYSQLISQAEKYNGRIVTLEAYYFGGFEISALSGSAGPASSGPWRIAPSGPLIWVEGGMTQDLLDRMYKQAVVPSGYSEDIGRLMITGKFESGGKYGHLDGYRYQISITKAELLEWSPPPAVIAPATTEPEITIDETETNSPPETPVHEADEDQLAGQKLAEAFIRNSSTFRFDGLKESLKLVRTSPGISSFERDEFYTFVYQTRHPGHSDRSGLTLEEAITEHQADIHVNLTRKKVVGAACDGTWDMINERDLAVTVSGIVVSGGDTSLPDGPLDTPRKFVYRIIKPKDQGFFVDVCYTSYPPSPAGEKAAAKIKLDFYRGTIEIGDLMEAHGTLDRSTNTLVIAEQGDYIRTFSHKSTVVGVVVGIKEIILSASRGSKPDEYIYELLRLDGTYVVVRNTLQAGIETSLIGETVRIADFMRATGDYDKDSNTVVVDGEGDLIKTYDYNPEIDKTDNE